MQNARKANFTMLKRQIQEFKQNTTAMQLSELSFYKNHASSSSYVDLQRAPFYSSSS